MNQASMSARAVEFDLYACDHTASSKPASPARGRSSAQSNQAASRRSRRRFEKSPTLEALISRLRTISRAAPDGCAATTSDALNASTTLAVSDLDGSFAEARGRRCATADNRSIACRVWVIAHYPKLVESAPAIDSTHQMFAPTIRTADRYADSFDNLPVDPRASSKGRRGPYPENPKRACCAEFRRLSRAGRALRSSLNTFRALSVDNRSFLASESLVTIGFA